MLIKNIKRNKPVVNYHSNLKKKDFEHINRNVSNTKHKPATFSQNNSKNDLMNNDNYLKFKTSSNSVFKEKSDSGNSMRDYSNNKSDKRYRERSNSPSNLEMKSQRMRHYPDKQRMDFLSQPRKLLKDKKKLRKRKKLMFKDSINLPTINSPAEVKNSLLNIAKARIYGVQIDRFPQLVEHQEKISEYKKKIKLQKMKDKPNK
jgi:hypothetical protein